MTDRPLTNEIVPIKAAKDENRPKCYRLNLCHQNLSFGAFHDSAQIEASMKLLKEIVDVRSHILLDF